MKAKLDKRPIRLSNHSILNELRAYEDRPDDSIAEYIWNGFDALANTVRVSFDFPEKIGEMGMGYPNLAIQDDGNGWDLANTLSVELFLDSQKRRLKRSYKSLPHGSKGVGRFTFYGFANSAEWNTSYQGMSYSLVLDREDISNYTLDLERKQGAKNSGTIVSFNVDSVKLDEGFFEVTLKERLLEKFAWFLKLYPEKTLSINNVVLDANDIIDSEKKTTVSIADTEVKVNLIKWNRPLANKEHSKLYFINSNGEEVFKCPTGLNYKADTFFHSAYVSSELFDDFDPNVEILETDDDAQIHFLTDNEKSKIVREVKEKVRKLLEEFRRPHIEKSSEKLINEWIKDKQYPEPEAFGADPNQYKELVKETFAVAPSLFLGISDDHRKIILNLLASLLGTAEKDLILTILNQVYDLSDEQKIELSDILKRTTLKNILNTIKEIDSRLQIIEDLDHLVNDSEIYKDVKEVDHLQKILNEHFWVFGEEYRLVIETEGSIKKAIKKWAQNILEIEDFNPESTSRKELDLLLSKKIESDTRILNIVVELKRPSVTLGQKELDQIKKYRDELLSEPACNGSGIEWCFILVGREYDKSISRAIESQSPSGEKHRGLVENVPSENTKIYVRQWTDIINVELRSKHRHLKDSLEIKLRRNDGDDIGTIVEEAIAAQSDRISGEKPSNR